MIVIQHLSAFFDPQIERKTIDVASLAEALELPFIKDWSTDPDFYRFSLSKGKTYGGQTFEHSYIMTEKKNGGSCYVTAMLKGWPDEAFSDLPRWKYLGKECAKALCDTWNREQEDLCMNRYRPPVDRLV